MKLSNMTDQELKWANVRAEAWVWFWIIVFTSNVALVVADVGPLWRRIVVLVMASVFGWRALDRANDVSRARDRLRERGGRS